MNLEDPLHETEPYILVEGPRWGDAEFLPAAGLSTAAVSMSPTGSCFSSESAPRPFHHADFEDEVEQPMGRPCR